MVYRVSSEKSCAQGYNVRSDFAEVHWHHVTINKRINGEITANKEYVGDITEPQSISIVFAICGAITPINYALIFASGVGKVYEDGKLSKVQDKKINRKDII